VAFISLYDTVVTDRQRLRPGSLPGQAAAARSIALPCCADLVLVDTQAQARHYAALLGLPEWRFHRKLRRP